MRRLLVPVLFALLLVAACGDADTDADDAPATTTTAASTTAAPTTTTAAPATEAPSSSTTAAPATATSTAAPTTTTVAPEVTEPVPLDELPRMLVANREVISLIDGSGFERELLTVDRPARIAHGVDETLIVVETVNSAADRTVTAFGSGPADTLATLGENPRLHDVVVRDGVPRILTTKDLGDGVADLVLIDPDGTETFIAPAADIEFSVVQASVSADRYSIAAYADLSEIVQIAPLDGSEGPALVSPTDELIYNAPPLIIYADLSDDASLLAHAEGPDFDGPTGAMVPAPWEVVVTEPATGQEVFRAPVTTADDGLEVTWVDFDGRWLLVSLGRAGDEVEVDPVEAMLFDLLAPDADPVTVPAIGTATLLAAG